MQLAWISRSEVRRSEARRQALEAHAAHEGANPLGDAEADVQRARRDILGRADHVICDLVSQAARLGELHHALEGGLVTTEDPVELGQLILSGKSVRTKDDELTVCDLTGVGVQDAAIAAYAVERARA